MSSNFIRIFFKKNTDLKQVETELSNNLDSNLVFEIDDSIIIDKKIKEITCDKLKLFILLEEIICATTRIKKGFTNSIGWKRKI